MTRHLALWGGYLALLLGLPLVFDSPLGLSVLTQMVIAIVFALSYNLLLGHGGMLSFGHAVYFGLGGFLVVHALLWMEQGGMRLPVPLLPLLGGIGGLLAGLILGSLATRRGGTAFAMITLGIGELLAAAALILTGAFGGEAGISGDRTAGLALLGVDFARDRAVYTLAAIWTFVATVGMYAFTQTPMGRLANAVRDNPQRVAFLGYAPARVRFISFWVAGMFAGLAGGLFALHYEIVTDEALSVSTSGNVLLATYIGGIGHFMGPMVGAVLLTGVNALLSNHTELWQLYLGLLFVLTVMFAPQGFAGLLLMHRRAWHRGTLPALIWPYLRTGVPALVGVAAVILGLELIHAGATGLEFFGHPLSAAQPGVWIGVLSVSVTSGAWVSRSWRHLRAAWDRANAEDRQP